MTKLRILAALVLSLVLPVALPGPASADTVTFKIRSFAQYAVQVKFFSQNRNVQWPAVGRAFDLKDYKIHNIRLNCVAGEKICYGAYLTGNAKRYWGVGADGKQRCASCCITCSPNGVSPVYDLNEKR